MPTPLKPAHLRQRRNKKTTATSLPAQFEQTSGEVPDIPNPGGREWHPLTLKWWSHVWESPMASQYLPTDVDGLGRLAMLVDSYYLAPDAKILGEVRLQEARFGLSPLDRSRLQWEIGRAEESEKKRRPVETKTAFDPRKALRAVK